MFCLQLKSKRRKYQIKEIDLKKNKNKTQQYKQHKNVSFKMYIFEAIRRWGELYAQFDGTNVCNVYN